MLNKGYKTHKIEPRGIVAATGNVTFTAGQAVTVLP